MKLYLPISAEQFEESIPLIVNRKEGSVLVRIPAGAFQMGDGTSRESPTHDVTLRAFYIGIYAVTNRQYRQFVEETGHPPPNQASRGEPIWQGNTFNEKMADHPVVCVTWEDAEAYCLWAGLRLPTEAEWEKAARGPDNLVFPWGNEWDEFRCRFAGNRVTETTCAVYAFKAGVSGYGCYNMCGNTWEWCRDWYEGEYYAKSSKQNPHGPANGKDRVTRGGGWQEVPQFCHAATRNFFDPLHRDDDLGFRVALTCD